MNPTTENITQQDEASGMVSSSFNEPSAKRMKMDARSNDEIEVEAQEAHEEEVLQQQPLRKDLQEPGQMKVEPQAEFKKYNESMDPTIENTPWVFLYGCPVFIEELKAGMWEECVPQPRNDNPDAPVFITLFLPKDTLVMSDDLHSLIKKVRIPKVQFEPLRIGFQTTLRERSEAVMLSRTFLHSQQRQENSLQRQREGLQGPMQMDIESRVELEDSANPDARVVVKIPLPEDTLIVCGSLYSLIKKVSAPMLQCEPQFHLCIETTERELEEVLQLRDEARRQNAFQGGIARPQESPATTEQPRGNVQSGPSHEPREEIQAKLQLAFVKREPLTDGYEDLPTNEEAHQDEVESDPPAAHGQEQPMNTTQPPSRGQPETRQQSMQGRIAPSNPSASMNQAPRKNILTNYRSRWIEGIHILAMESELSDDNVVQERAGAQ